MKKLFVILICFPCFIFGQQTINDSILINGIYRQFIIYVPSIYKSSQPTPLIFNFHARNSNACKQMRYGDFRKISDTANFIILHPQGLKDNSGVTHWSLGHSKIDDIGFLISLYSYIVSNYNINLDRVYSTGMSNGGLSLIHI